MKKLLIQLSLLLSCLFLVSQAGVAGWDPNEKAELQRDAAEAIRKFKNNDPSLKSFFNQASGYVVFPTVGKGGIGIGGAYGEGVVYAGGQVIGYSSLKQVTIGFQLGGQAYSELIFFKDKATLDRFKSEKVEFDAQLSAVAATAGAAANADYSSGVAVFTLTKGGLMYEASVGGQHFSFDAK
ncbi:MAG: YSC84-related protein [Chromatiales bacterium]|jgi:lipid-binding SYLF domain-containing protein